MAVNAADVAGTQKEKLQKDDVNQKILMNKSVWSSVRYEPNSYLCKVNALQTVESARTRPQSFSH